MYIKYTENKIKHLSNLRHHNNKLHNSNYIIFMEALFLETLISLTIIASNSCPSDP